MQIQPLPATSIRALGSGQVLTDSLALIKELLDNALDASSTQISVEVSQNTLDLVQVKDNGQGIPEEDRDAMAVRYCTSKITDFGDIQNCRSLGFRGEALASAAELAGTLVVTTRVEGEKIATACTCDRAGRVVGRKPVSAPVGTTVRVSDFFKHLPVRRENANKGAAKTIARVRTLLQKYYINHPRCRFSLRILASPQRGGTKAVSEDIVYAPSKSVKEAVQKAVGKDVAAACEWIDTSSAEYAEALAEGNAEDEIENDEDAIVIEALLPRPGTDSAVISKRPNCTHFISVDSRLVSCTRGTMKQIHSLYKSYLKSACPMPGLSDPFIYLNISCPPGTYDPNIEPAKDDVLFDDEEAIVQAVERVLRRFYGELRSVERVGKGKAGEQVKKNGFEMLLARKPKTPAPVVVVTPSKERWPKPLSPARPATTMIYDGVNEEEEEMAAMAVDIVMGEGRGTNRPPVAHSPVIDKQRQGEMSLAVENRKDEDQQIFLEEDEPVLPENHHGQPKETEHDPVVPGTGTGTEVPVANMDASGLISLVTPRRKTTNWGFNMSGGLSDDDDDNEMDGRLELHESDNDEAAQRDITLSNPWTAAKLNAPIVSSPLSSSPESGRKQARNPFKPPRRTRGSSPVLPESATIETLSELPTPSPSSPAARIFRENGGSVIYKPKPKRPVNKSAVLMNSWVSRGMRGEDGDTAAAKGPAEEGAPSKSNPGFVSAAKVHLQQAEAQANHNNDYYDDDSMDRQYQNPKRPIRVREIIKSNEPPKRRRLGTDKQATGFTPINLEAGDDIVPARTGSSPHKNRFLAATAALNTPLGEEVSRRQSTRERKQKRRRTKTLLPLDNVPDPLLQTHQFSKTVDLVLGDRLKNMFKGLRGSDGYVGGTMAGVAVQGKRVEGMFFSECAAWDEIDVLGELVKQWMLGVAEVEMQPDVEKLEWEWEEVDGVKVLRAVGAEEGEGEEEMEIEEL